MVGPLALYSFGQTTHDGRASLLDPSSIDPAHPVKLLALVRPGDVVSLAIPPSEEREVSLAYRPGIQPATVAEGDTTVTYHACTPPSGTRPGIAHWTQFNGGLVVAGARCATFIVRTQSSTREFVFALGKPRCGR